MNTIARFIVWSFWFVTTVIGSIYCGVCAKFLTSNFSCYKRSSRCLKHVETFNNGLNAGSILTMILVCLYMIVSLGFILSKRRYIEAMSLGSSYNLSVCMLLFSIYMHTAETTRILWSNNNKKIAYKATYVLGYVLSGFYALWFVLILIYRKTKSSTLNQTNNV